MDQGQAVEQGQPMDQGQAVEQGQAMDVDHDDLSAIVAGSKAGHANSDLYNNWGTSIDLYKFSNSQGVGWKRGHIFHGSNREDISFEGGIIEDIKPRDDINTREAMFLVKEPNLLDSVEDMLIRSSTLNHIGILKPYIAGFNTQISKAVTGFSVTTSSLADWIKNKQLPDNSSDIPVEVQQVIRTAYMAIVKMWSAGSTSDELANSDSYYMIGDRIKINPLRTRRRLVGENNNMPLRRAFGDMIRSAIYSKWNDNELLDFIDLLGYQAAGVEDVLGHPVLLSPHRRQLMYFKFDTESLGNNPLGHNRRNWLQANARPEADWIVGASTFDPVLKKIIAYQARQFIRKNEWGRYGDDDLVQHHRSFDLDFFGALHFSSVVTAHYGQHFNSSTQGNQGEEIKCRVDFVLKKVLPRLLTRRYNVKFVNFHN